MNELPGETSANDETTTEMRSSKLDSMKPFVFIREQCCKILIVATVASALVSCFPSSEMEEKEKLLNFNLFLYSIELYLILIKLFFFNLLHYLFFIFYFSAGL